MSKGKRVRRTSPSTGAEVVVVIVRSKPPGEEAPEDAVSVQQVANVVSSHPQPIGHRASIATRSGIIDD
jgi:hypothetical protein